MSNTYGWALSRAGVSVPDHLAVDAEVPILDGPQAQGDVLVVPVRVPMDVPWVGLPTAGILLIQGEATGNTHWLHPGFESTGVVWSPSGSTVEGPTAGTEADVALVLAYLRVPHGESALLIHTDEHGANGIGPGSYELRRKRQVSPKSPSKPSTTRREHPGWGLLED